MLVYDSRMPGDVSDKLLWRDARQTLDRHAEPGTDGCCVWCGEWWPCPPRQLAERAEAAALTHWRGSWVAHDSAPVAESPWRGHAQVPYHNGHTHNGYLS